MATPTLPRTLYIKEEQDGDTTYFCASEDVDDLVGMGDTETIGTYVLTHANKFKGVVVKK